MKKENKDILLKLLQQHKALGISDQIDFDKFYLYSIIVQHFGIPATSAKRYLRHLTEFGYLKAFGGNKNRSYRKRSLNNQFYRNLQPATILSFIRN